MLRKSSTVLQIETPDPDIGADAFRAGFLKQRQALAHQSLQQSGQKVVDLTDEITDDDDVPNEAGNPDGEHWQAVTAMTEKEQADQKGYNDNAYCFELSQKRARIASCREARAAKRARTVSFFDQAGICGVADREAWVSSLPLLCFLLLSRSFPGLLASVFA